MTKHYPQYQSITSPLSSREKGDWGIKRPFPIKTTMATSTPLLRVKQVDSVEHITDLESASDHSLSLEKFQEMRIALTTPPSRDRRHGAQMKNENPAKSVFEEGIDETRSEPGARDNRRWKFGGPWLARMTEGQFIEYVKKAVRPQRARFRGMLREKMAGELTVAQTNLAMEEGKPAPAPVKPEDIGSDQFTEYLRTLRNDRVSLYSIVSKFLDLPPLGQPAGVRAFWASGESPAAEGPWAKSGPPPMHPSAGISYLRTTSYVENHPLYGPQARRTPVQARVIYPRHGASPAKLGVGGFVADAPPGENEFNYRFRGGQGSVLKGITHLDTTTFGGAKAYVDPQSACVDPSGSVIVQLRETHQEAQMIAKERKGLATVYQDTPKENNSPLGDKGSPVEAIGAQRMGRLSDAILAGNTTDVDADRKDIWGSSSSYGLMKDA